MCSLSLVLLILVILVKVVFLLVFSSLVGISGIRILGFLTSSPLLVERREEEEGEVKEKREEGGVDIEVFTPLPLFPFLLSIFLT